MKNRLRSVTHLVLYCLLAGVTALPLVIATVGWSQTYGGGEADEIRSLIETSDGGYALAGITRSFGDVIGGDFWLVKVDSTGRMQWNKTYGVEGYGEEASSVIQTHDGGYALAGHSTYYGVGTTPDFWLVKTDSLGNVEWNKTYGYGGWDFANCIVQTNDGGYVLTGEALFYESRLHDFWLVKVDSHGNQQWNQTYGGTSKDTAQCVIQTVDGGYVLAGYTLSYGSGGFDALLVKTDPYGNVQWNKTYGGTNDDTAWSVIQTSDDNYVFAGSSSFDFWLVKVNSSGNAQWNETYASSGIARSVVQTSDGGYALAGSTEFYDAGGGDCFLVKVDTEGRIQWNQTYGGEGHEEACSVIQTGEGGYALGITTGSYGAGGNDFWLVKTDEKGIVPEFQLVGLPLLMIITVLAVLIRRKKIWN